MRVLIYFLFPWTYASAWGLVPNNVKQHIGSVIVASTVSLTSPGNTWAAPPSTSLQVQADIPGLLKDIKNHRRELIEDFEQIKKPLLNIGKIISPHVQVQLPVNVPLTVRNALAGEISATVNGEDVLARVESEEEALAFNIEAGAFGNVVVFAQSSVLPKLPLLPSVQSNNPSAPRLLKLAATVPPNQATESSSTSSPVGRTSSFDQWSSPAKWKAQDFIGIGSLGLGLIYGGSYYYYQELVATEEREAQDRKEKAAKAAAAKKVEATPQVVPKKEKAEALNQPKAVKEVKIDSSSMTPSGTSNNEKPITAAPSTTTAAVQIATTVDTVTRKSQEEKAVKAAMAAVDAAKTSPSIVKQSPQPWYSSRNPEQEVTLEEDEESISEAKMIKPKRQWFRFWRWFKNK